MLNASGHIRSNTYASHGQQQIESMAERAKHYIDENDFVNVGNKVGYFDERKIPLYASYNMSYIPIYGREFHGISDSLGREVLYFCASDSVAPSKLYRATRVGNGPFLYENSPLVPAYMRPNPSQGITADNSYPIKVCGLGCRYIVYACKYKGANKIHLVYTQFSSDPAKWSSFIDVTSIVNGSELGIFCNEEYMTMATVSNSVQPILRLYDRNFNLLKTEALINIAGVADFSPYYSHTDLTLAHQGGAAYIKDQEMLAVYLDLQTYLKTSEMAPSYHNARTGLLLYKVPVIWFRDGQAQIVNQIAPTEYKVDTSGIGIKGGRYGTHVLVYDEYQQVLRNYWQPRDSTDVYFYRIPREQISYTALIEYANSDFTANVKPPDACAWSKVQYMPKLFQGHLYLDCISSSYGRRATYSNYEKLAPSSRTLRMIPGTWYLENFNISCFAIQCFKNANGYVEWDRVCIGAGICPVSIAVNGQRSLGAPSGVTIPGLPSAYVPAASEGSCAYNKRLRKAYFIVSYRTAPAGELQGASFLLEYDFSSSAWKEHKNITAAWKNLNQQSYNSYITYASMSTYSNFFIDADNTLFIDIHAAYASGHGDRIVKIVPQADGSVSMSDARGVGAPWYGYPQIGYDPVFGYFMSNADWRNAYIYASKDYGGTGSEKSRDQVLVSGDQYAFNIGLNSSTGLVAYCQQVPLLLGGFYSIVPPQEVVLKPNTDNYVYFERDQKDKSRVNVKLFTSKQTLSEQQKFYTILATKITTDEGNPIAQESFDI